MGISLKREKRFRRHQRVRAKIFGTLEKPRLCLFRSAKHIYAQLIDDERRITLAAASDLELENRKIEKEKKEIKKEEKKRKTKKEKAYLVGQLIAQKALEKKIEKVVFDRGGYKYHGRVKALAEGARAGGLKF